MLQALEDRLGLEQLHPRRGQLDRQRHAVEAGADAGDGRSVVVRDGEPGLDRHGPGDEQLDRLVLGDRLRRARPLVGPQVELLELGQREEVERDRQAGNRVLLLPGDPQRGPARGDDRDVRARAEEIPDDGRAVDDLLEVVEDEQDPARSDPLGQQLERRPSAGLDEPDRPGDDRRDEGRISNGLERHEPQPVRVAFGNIGGELEREAGLARPAGAGQREQPRRLEQAAGLGQLRLAPDEARQLRRKVVRAGCRATGSAGTPSAARRR